MIQVKVSNSKKKIALVKTSASGDELLMDFPYQQAKEISMRIVRDQGIFIGVINLSLSQYEVNELVRKITKGYQRINEYLTAEPLVEPYFSRTYGKWVVKISNRSEKTRFLAVEAVDSFLSEIQATRNLVFQDQSTVVISETHFDDFVSKLNHVKEDILGGKL
jgi:hypothetical protein